MKIFSSWKSNVRREKNLRECIPGGAGVSGNITVHCHNSHHSR